MADNVNITPGTGVVVATDEVTINGTVVQVQRVKIVQGADGVNSGDLEKFTATDDAAFTAGSGIVVPAGGVYQATVDEVDANDAGAVRMTKRRALINAADFLLLTLTAATPVPSGSDVLNSAGGAIVAGDLAIRDTNPHMFAIPMASAGWRKLVLGFKSATVFDVTLKFTIQGGISGTAVADRLFQATMNAGIAGFGVGEGAVGTGGAAGADPVAFNAYWFNVPAINAGFQAINLIIEEPGGAPASGTLEIYICRMT